MKKHLFILGLVQYLNLTLVFFISKIACAILFKDGLGLVGYICFNLFLIVSSSFFKLPKSICLAWIAAISCSLLASLGGLGSLLGAGFHSEC